MVKLISTDKNRKNGRIAKGLSLLFSLFIILAIISCDENVLEGAAEDDSYEARIEAARIALDDQDYPKAKKLLEGLKSDYPNEQEVCEYLSHAYSGLTGLDTFSLLRTLDELEEKSDAGNIAMIGLVLGDENGTLTSEQVVDKVYYIELAISAYAVCIPFPDDNQTVQLGLLSVVDAALRIGGVVLDDLDASSITLTEDGLRELYDNPTANFGAIPFISETISRLNEDSERIAAAVAVLDRISGEDNDIEDSFSEFKQDLDPDGDGVDLSDLENYINDLVNE